MTIRAPYSPADFAKRPTRVLIHGWPGLFGSIISGKPNGVDHIRDAYKKFHTGDNEKNIVLVLWDPASIFFHVAREYSFVVAEKVSRMLDTSLGDNKLAWKNLTIVGHSLGAHIAGFVGKRVKKGRVGTIIGLDPAGKLSSRTSFELFNFE